MNVVDEVETVNGSASPCSNSGNLIADPKPQCSLASDLGPNITRSTFLFLS